MYVGSTHVYRHTRYMTYDIHVCTLLYIPTYIHDWTSGYFSPEKFSPWKVIHSSFPPTITLWPHWPTQSVPLIKCRDSFSGAMIETFMPKRANGILFDRGAADLCAFRSSNRSWQVPRHFSHVAVCTDGWNWNAMDGAKNPFFSLSIPKNHKKVHAICNVQIAGAGGGDMRVKYKI